jgi:hypothetical protein
MTIRANPREINIRRYVMKNLNFPYENLANAIILQAVKDYREALSRYDLHREKNTYRQDKESIERFFRSGWFGVLSKLDPEMLICRLNEEVA